jgi:hypothetical protein
MLLDAIKLCREKAEGAQKAANALQAGKAEQLAGEAAFGLLVLEESMREAQYLSLDDLRAMAGVPKPRPIDLDEYPDGVSDDDPEQENPETKRRREEFKDRGFFG